MKAKREALTAGQISAYHLALHRHVLTYLDGHPAFDSIMTYYPIQKEAHPFSPPGMQKMLRERVILLPRIEQYQPPEMSAVPFQGVGSGRGSFSNWQIFEPAGAPYPPELIDCVLVPGLAFDVNGYRLGYGKGFYDAFLPRLKPGTPMIGIGYSLQLTANTFPQPHDVKLTGLITEKGLQVFE